MISPEMAQSVPQAEQEQKQAGYEKVDMGADAIIAVITNAGVELDKKASDAIAKGKILAVYRNTEAVGGSVLVAVGEKVVVIVLRDVPLSEAQAYSGAKLVQYDMKGAWAVHTGGYAKQNPAGAKGYTDKIAEFNAGINDSTVSEETKAELRKKRDAYISGSKAGAETVADPQEVLRRITDDFLKARGGELAPGVVKALNEAKEQGKQK